MLPINRGSGRGAHQGTWGVFQRFTSLDALQGIGQNLLVRFLEPFTADLAAKGIPHPNPNLPDHSYFQAAATLFALPELLPPRLSEALSAIEEMSHPECRRRIETALSALQSTTATPSLRRR